ncbi:MAG: hypothetical protein OEM82_12140 [Acidobacteriota bacterium]|nr:hypothetical protein [Acidobacteriota bacterium]
MNRITSNNQGVSGYLRAGMAAAVRAAVALIVVTFLLDAVYAQEGKTADREERSLLVTALVHNERTRDIAAKLEPVDFAVSEQAVRQKILSARKVESEPLVIAVLLQDNLVSRVNNELDLVRKFIQTLPDGSRVMTAYISTGALQVKQGFTEDRFLAARSLRIIAGSSGLSPYSPYIQIKDAVKRFKGEPVGRRMVLVVTDGFDDTIGSQRFGSFYSAYLDGAIDEAQRSGVTIYAVYAPSANAGRNFRHAVNASQGSLLRLTEETGGEAFFSGTDFVTFDPYFREFGEMLSNQWVIVYESSNKGRGFRKIEVTTDFDINLHYPAGYKVN